MPNISEEEYGALERKIQAEIRKIFKEFAREYEKKPAVPDLTVDKGQSPKPKHRAPPQVRRQRAAEAAAGIRRDPRPRKKFDTNRLLYGNPPAPKISPEHLIEHDMDKIFRKKHQRGSGKAAVGSQAGKN